MRTLLLLAAAILLLSDPASAQVPQLLSCQGVLTDNAGIIVPDGAHDLTFRIFNVDVGGAALFTETQSSLPVVRGGFSALIGSVTPLTLPFDVQYWLEIQVDADAPLTPRVKLTSAPYALMAKTVPDGAITNAKIATGAVNSAKIADNSISTSDIADGNVRPADLSFNEPGVASAIEGVASVPLTPAIQTLLSQSITVPTLPGYGLVIASAQVNVFHTNGTTDNLTFGVGDAPGAFFINQDVGLAIPASAPTGTYIFPVTVHSLFDMAPGTITFYFLGNATSGSGSVNDLQLSVLFAQYAYGTVESIVNAPVAIQGRDPARSSASPTPR